MERRDYERPERFPRLRHPGRPDLLPVAVIELVEEQAEERLPADPEILTLIRPRRVLYVLFRELGVEERPAR
jgi:hypothetical protein